MINLTEAWKAAYEDYLDKEYASLDIDGIITEMDAANTEAKHSFDLIEQFITLQDDPTFLLEDETGKNAVVSMPAGKSSTDGNSKSGDDDDKKDNKATLEELISYLINMKAKDSALSYKPESFIKVERIGDMKFPNNLIFFLKQLALWIRNVVIFFINKILNAIRVLIGKPTKELDGNALKVSFEKASKLAVKGAEFHSDKPEDLKQFVQVVDIEDLREDASFASLFGLEPKTNGNNKGSNDKVISKVVVINVDKDLEDLRLTMTHFFDLFDQAYGSNSENLFDTGDLQLIFSLFKNTFKGLMKGEIPNVALVGGHATEIQAIDPAVVRNNLRLTQVNINSLKDAYQNTALTARKIMQMIQSKEMLMLTNFVGSGQTLSASTLSVIIGMNQAIGAKQKEVVKLGRKLEKTREMYENLTKKLGSLQKSVVNIGSIQYSTIFTKRVKDLFDASRDMTDIVKLRLSACALYLAELKGIRDTLSALVRLNKK